MSLKKIRENLGLKEYAETAKETGKVFKWLWKEAIDEESRKWLYRIFAWMFVLMVFQLIQPAIVGFILKGLTLRDWPTLKWGFGALIASLIIQKLSERFQMSSREWFLGKHWQRFDDRITELFFEKSVGQHIHEGNTFSVASIDKGRWKAVELIKDLLFDGIPIMVQLILSLVLLCFLNLVAGAVMLGIFLIYVSWSFYLNRKVQIVCLPIDRDLRALNKRRVSRWTNVERVKTSGKEEDETKEMSLIFEEILTTDRIFWLWYIKISNRRSLVNAFGLVSILAWGSWLVWTNVWNVGFLFPLYSWASRVSENMWQIGKIEHEISWIMPSVKFLVDSLSVKPNIIDQPGAVTLDPSIPHRIEFIDVSHAYQKKVEDAEEDGQLNAITNISFSIEPGEIVALLGPSGAGKSTIMKKLLRFDDPTSGRIEIDGKDLREISQASWRNGIGYIPQQSQVLDGTIRENLLYGYTGPKMDDKELWKLMKLLQIDFGKRLAQGLNTLVGERGIKLSGGQAQRLMIGSAVIKKPWLLVIDEATSSLDSTTEKLVQNGLNRYLSERNTSVLIVAHRLPTIRDIANKIVVLKPAHEVITGQTQIEAIASNFEDLNRISPTFHRLAMDQGIKI